MVPAAAARTGSLVLLLARPPAVVSAALPPFALAIAYAAQRLPTGGATVARLAVADLGGRFIATRSVAAARRQKNSCCVTTRRRNFRILWCLRRRYGTLPARALGLGVLDFGGIVLTSSGLPPRRLPASDQAQAFGVLAVTLVGAPWLVLASTALAQTEPRPWSSAAAVWLMMRMAHGSAFSQGTARGERAIVLLGR